MNEASKAMTIVFVLSNLYMWSTLAWYITLRKRPWVALRPFTVNVACSVLGIIYMNTLVPRLEVFPNFSSQLQCWFTTVIQPLVLVSWLTLMILRGVFLLVTYARNEYFAQSKASPPDLNNSSAPSGTHLNIFDQFVYRQIKSTLQVNHRTSMSSLSQAQTSYTKLIWKQFLVINGVFWIIILICTLIDVDRWTRSVVGPQGICLRSATQWVSNIIILLIIFVMFPLMLYAIRSIRDNYRVGVELTVVMAIAMSAFLIYIGDRVIKIFPSSHNVYQWAAIQVCHTLSVTLPCIMAVWSRRKSSRILLQYDHKTFQDVLDSEQLYPLLRRQLAKDLCMENILFYEKVQTLKETASHHDSTTKLDTMMHDICKEFIMPNGKNELNIPDKTRKEVTGKWKKGELHVEHFDAVAKDVLDLIYKNSFPRFVAQFKDHMATSSMELEIVEEQIMGE